MEKFQKSLRDSKGARWIALIIVSFMMLCGYFFTDVMAPLKGLLENQLGWTSSEFGLFNSGYGWFNVFLLMLIIGGIILDKMGVRFSGTMASILMVLGAVVKYWAVTTHALDGQMFLGAKMQVLVAGMGFAIFGVGVEVAGITVSKVIVKWFKGKEMALAMGMEMAMARIGTGLAIASSSFLAGYFTLSTPILLGLVLLCVGMIAFFIYTFQDKKLENEIRAVKVKVEEEESFKIKDILSIFVNRGWWYIAILCVLFYSAVFPFLKYATDLMVQKFHVNPSFAGTIPSLLPFGTILLTPFFGNLYDRRGKGASIMVLGSFMLICIHGLFSVPFLDFWWIAVILILSLGVAFSLVPSAMWPSVPKIIPEKQLGTAYSMIFWVQNIGLMCVPWLIGKVLDNYCIVNIPLADGSIQKYDYTLPMLIFTCFGILALVFAYLLKKEDKRKGYGLELPNIVK